MKIVINPTYNYLKVFLQTLPSAFPESGEVIYEGRNVLKTFEVGTVSIVVKSFKIPLWINRFVYTYVRKSKARRSYEHSVEIIKRGFMTPLPVGYVAVLSSGFLSHSYYISLLVENAETIRPYMDFFREEDEDLRIAFSRYTADLHSAGVYHIDYSPGNILVKKQNGQFLFYLVDVNRMQFRKLSMKDVYKNLSRLCTSRDVFIAICKEYARYRQLEENRFVSSALEYRAHFFRNYTFRLSFKAWKKGHKDCLLPPAFRYCLYNSIASIFRAYSRVHKKFIRKKRVVYETYLREHDCGSVFPEKLLSE